MTLRAREGDRSVSDGCTTAWARAWVPLRSRVSHCGMGCFFGFESTSALLFRYITLYFGPGTVPKNYPPLVEGGCTIRLH